MKNTLKVLLVGLALMTIAGQGVANTTAQTLTVTSAGTYGDGRVYVQFSATVTEPGCNATYLTMASTTPGVKQALQVALSALALSRTVTVKTTGCNGTYSPVLDGTANSYLMMN